MKSLRFGKDNPAVSLDLILIVAIALAVLLRLLNLATREFWYDEVLSLLLATGQKTSYPKLGELPVDLDQYTALLNLPLESGLRDIANTAKDLLRGMAGGEPHPPLLFLGQHVWLRLFGNSEAAVRSLEALLSLAAIGGVYGLGRTVLNHRGGLILAALLGLNPFFLFHSLNVRMYGPLVLWVVLSAWALLQLIHPAKSQSSHRFTPILWNLLLIGSVAAGLLTFYLFAYWILTLAVLVLYLDRRHWWQHALRLGTGVLLTAPWMLWGLPQQLRNADLDRFGSSKAAVSVGGLRHLFDFLETLGINLLTGDWITSLPSGTAIGAGIAVAIALGGCALALWRQGERHLAGTALILGLFPLLLGFTADVVTQKFTISFGWGRSLIVILPGCLLLLTAWLVKASGRWFKPAIAAILLLYLSLSVGDFTFRQRQMFQAVNQSVQQASNTPSLIAMNSRAWGHVMRLAYYVESSSPVSLLAREASDLGASLEQVFSQPNPFGRILWLNSHAPVWSPASTPTETQQIQSLLSDRCRLVNTQELTGTMNLDHFTLSVYDCPTTAPNT